jgi:hypothetical protein
MRVDPGMVGRHVIRDPVEDEPEAACGELLARRRESRVAAELLSTS